MSELPNIPMASLIMEIEAYLSATGVSESRFGEAALKDHKLVPDLRAGRELRRATEARIREHMASNPPQDNAA